MAVSPWPLLSPWPTTPAAITAATNALAAAVGSSEDVAGRLGPVVAALVERYADGRSRRGEIGGRCPRRGLAAWQQTGAAKSKRAVRGC